MIKWFTNIFGLPLACAAIGAVTVLVTVVLPLGALLFDDDQNMVLIGLFITKILGVPWSFIFPIQAANGDVGMQFLKSGLGVMLNGAILGGLAGVFFAFLTPYDQVGSDLDDDLIKEDKNPYRFDN